MKTKKVDWRSPGFITKGSAQYIDQEFHWEDATNWCEENCLKRFYIFAEALLISWTFEVEIDSILFGLNWKQVGREYYMILRDDK